VEQARKHVGTKEQCIVPCSCLGICMLHATACRQLTVPAVPAGHSEAGSTAC
jgi:hypothetical protein